jgi:DNA-binding transcriptional regulator GbsR (MarR family)
MTTEEIKVSAKVKKIEVLAAKKAKAIGDRDAYVRMGEGFSVLLCNLFIAECDEKIARLSQATRTAARRRKA